MHDPATLLYRQRKERRSHPEGQFGTGGRWYPSGREDADGDGTCVRAPTRKRPYSYMLRCRTLQHCRVLVRRANLGYDVPRDVLDVLSLELSCLRPSLQELLGLTLHTPESIARDLLEELPQW